MGEVNLVNQARNLWDTLFQIRPKEPPQGTMEWETKQMENLEVKHPSLLDKGKGNFFDKLA